MVATHRVHPFKLWLINNGVEQQAAAASLGVTPSWLSSVMKRKATPSRALYRGMVRFSRNGVTMKELCAFEAPSEHSRKILPSAEPVRKRAAKRKPRAARDSAAGVILH